MSVIVTEKGTATKKAEKGEKKPKSTTKKS